MTGIHVVLFVSGIPSNSERDWSLHFDSTDRFHLCLLTLFFCLCFLIKRQQKPSLFFTQKRMAVEPENQEYMYELDKGGEAGEVRY